MAWQQQPHSLGHLTGPLVSILKEFLFEYYKMGKNGLQTVRAERKVGPYTRPKSLYYSIGFFFKCAFQTFIKLGQWHTSTILAIWEAETKVSQGNLAGPCLQIKKVKIKGVWL